MAPKVRGSSSKSKGKRKMSEAPLFENNEQMENFTKFSNRSIVYGKVFNDELFSSKGLNLRDLFAKQGIIRFVGVCLTAYNRLIRLFYSNLSWKDARKKTLCTYLHGSNFSFTVENFAEIFSLPRDQVSIINAETRFKDVPGFNLAEALNLICKNPTDHPPETLSVSDLSIQSRLIHHIIGYCILPRSGSRAYVSSLDILLIWAVTTGFKVDFANLMFNHLMEVSERQNAALPYGMALTALFFALGIDASSETDTYNPTSHDWYNEHTLRQMHYTIENNRWVAIAKPSSRRQPTEEEEEPAEEELTNQQLYDRMSSNFQQMDMNFHRMDSNFQRMDVNFEQVFGQINTGNTHIRGIEDYLRSKDEDASFPPW